MAQISAGGNLSGIAEVAKKSGISAPAIVIIGEVAGLETEFDWFGKNRRILYTGLSDERYFLKGTYFHLPLIEIKPAVNYRKFDREVKNIETYDWIVFSSRYGVDYFFERLALSGQDARSLAGLKIAAVGGSTARKLLEYGILADLVPKLERAAGLLKAFRKRNLSGEKMLLPRSDIADKGLNEGLKKLGAQVVSVVAYKNVMPEDLPDLDLNFFDEIYFTSPSTVRNFKKRYKKIPRGVKVRWIGDVTKKEVRRQFRYATV
jgi:uroporphyrinogen III methyltransferase/synthase